MTLTLVGRLSECLLLAYRTPAESVAHLVPRGLELVTHGPWAFWNLVACRVEAMRPAGFPRWCGVSYHHVACRLHVRATGGSHEGLFFVRSDADHPLVARLGNLVSDFRFHPARITLAAAEDAVELVMHGTQDGQGDARLRAVPEPAPQLARGSCFSSLPEARAFLKYRPLGLSCHAKSGRLKLAEVFRDETQWCERPFRVIESHWPYLESLGQRDLCLELATRVAPIDYRWRLGRCV